MTTKQIGAPVVETGTPETEYTMRANRSVTPDPQRSRIVGCAGCAGHQRPGYVREWTVDPTSPNGMRWVWKRCPEQCTAESRRESVNRQLAARGFRPIGSGVPTEVLAQDGARCGNDPRAQLTDGDRAAVDDFREHLAARAREDQDHGDAHQLVHAQAPAESTSAPARTTRSNRSTRPGVRTRATATADGPALVAAVAVDADDAGRLVVDVDGIPAPAGDCLADLFAWLATRLPLGTERLHKDGRRSNGTVCLSAQACRVLEIPQALPKSKAAVTALEKRLSQEAETAGLSMGQLGSATLRVFETEAPKRGAKISLRLLIVPWLASPKDGSAERISDYTASLAQGPEGEPDARTLARRLRTFAADVGFPARATAAVTARDLLDAVRPREEWGEDRRRVLKADALPSGDLCVPVAAGRRHPLTAGRLPHDAGLCWEEDYHWERVPTAEELALPWAVAVDVSASYLSVAESLRVPVGPLQHTTAPVWDGGKTAGLWLCDFTGLAVEDVLPHPATPNGKAPDRPRWYATPTVAYMVTAYGFDPAAIGEAYVSTNTAQLFRQWAPRIRDAYKRQLAVLGLADGMEETEFLAAHAARKDTRGEVERADAVVLVAAYQELYKKGVGRWCYQADAEEMPEADWLDKVVKHWSYRPEIRFHVIAAARIATHRRMRKTYQLTGRAPFGVGVDSLLYACEDRSVLPLIPHGEDGRPVAGALRLGVAPGSVKHDKTIPMDDVREHLATGKPLERLTKRYSVDGLKNKENNRG